MKKGFLAWIMVVAIGFLSAFWVCVRALRDTSVGATVEVGMRVVVDAGHGGIDGGVVGRVTKTKESDVNLALAFALQTELLEMGFEVTLTRKMEAGLYGTTARGFKKRDMERRKEIIEETRPDFILSLHQNFYPSSASRGAQVFYASNSEEGRKLALQMQTRLNELYKTEGARGRKASKGDFFMLHCWDCPSILVECGFLSNAEDERLLCTGTWRKKLAKSLASGLVAYLSERFV